MLYLDNRIIWSLGIKSLDDETQKLDLHVSVHRYRKCLGLVRSLIHDWKANTLNVLEVGL